MQQVIHNHFMALFSNPVKPMPESIRNYKLLNLQHVAINTFSIILLHERCHRKNLAVLHYF